MALDKDKIEAGLARVKELEQSGGAMEEIHYKEGMNHYIKSHLHSKMMDEEELSEDDIRAISEVSNTFGVSMDRYLGDYLDAMEEQGYDTSGMQEIANSVGAEVSKPTQSGTAGIDFTSDEKAFIQTIADKQNRSYEDIEQLAIENNRDFKKEFKAFVKEHKKKNKKATEINKKSSKEKPVKKEAEQKAEDGYRGTYDDRNRTQKDRNRRMRPDDFIEQLSGADIGSPEYTATKEALDELKKINSTGKINRNLTWLGYFGAIGMIVSLFIGLLGFQFDVSYHMPKLEAVIGESGVWIFSAFGALLIMALLHIPMDALVNRRYKTASRNLLLVLLVAGAGLKIYIDSRVTDLYSKKIAEENRVSNLTNSTKVVGNEYTNIKNTKERQEHQVDKIDKDIDFYREQLKQNMEQRKAPEAFVTKYAPMSSTQWRREHLKEKRNILEKLDRDKMSIENHINLLESKKDEYLSVSTKNANKLTQLLEETQKEAKKDGEKRKYMLWAILLMIELSSLLKIYSDFIRNKNTPIELKVLDKTNTFLDAGQTINHMGEKLSQVINRANQVRGDQIRDSIEFWAYSNVQSEQHAIGNAHKLGALMRKNTDTTMELMHDMAEGRIYQLQAQRAERKVQLLEDKFQELQ